MQNRALPEGQLLHPLVESGTVLARALLHMQHTVISFSILNPGFDVPRFGFSPSILSSLFFFPPLRHLSLLFSVLLRTASHVHCILPSRVACAVRPLCLSPPSLSITITLVFASRALFLYSCIPSIALATF